MKNLTIVLFAFLFLYVSAEQAFTQKKFESVDKIIFKVEKSSGDITFFETLVSKKAPIHKGGFGVKQSHGACDVSLNTLAMEKNLSEATVRINIETRTSKKSSSQTKKFDLKKGETKLFKLNFDLKCSSYEYFLVTAHYENQDK